MDFGIMSLGDHLPDAVTGQRVTQAGRLRSVVDSAAAAEGLGFAVVALGEHHFNDYIISSPQLLLAAIAERTSALRLATGVTLLATSDPVRIAEDFATLDQLSGGRVELVVGRGISGREYDVFGGLDPARGHDILTEKLALLTRIWAGDEPVSWSGQFRSPLEQVRVQPRPYAAAPRVWLGTGMSEESVRRTAALGLPLMLPSIFKRAETWAPMVALYRELMTRAGRTPLVGCCSHVHVSATSQLARREWRPYLRQYVDWANALRGVDTKIDIDRLFSGPALCGSPGEICDRLLSLQQALAPDLHLSVFDIGGLPHRQLLATMELFAAEVMPKL